MTEQLVSVIIPFTTERESLLKRALMSVNNQTYPNIEVILVKDGPGALFSWLKQKETIRFPIHIIETQKRVGPSQARNLGANKASGEFLSFLDSDDEWFPEKLELQMRCFRNDAVGVVGADQYIMDDKIGRKFLIHSAILKGRVFHTLALSPQGIQASFLIVRRKYFEQVGGFNERLGYAEEKDLELRLAKICEFDWVERPLGIQHGNHGLPQQEEEGNKEMKGVKMFLEVWEKEIHSCYGDKGMKKFRGMLLNGAIRKQLLSGATLINRLKVLFRIKINELRYINFIELVKLIVLTIFGNQIMKLWKILRWKKS